MLENSAKLIVASEFKNMRLDIFICKNFPRLTRNFVHKLFINKKIFLNEKLVSKHHRIRCNDVVLINFPKSENCSIVAKKLKIDVVYEDEFLMVVNKPKGMVVHPAPGHYDDTLVNALMWHCKNNLSDIGGVLRPGIVHRIDKDTSGLLLIAKTNEAYFSLVEQIKNREVSRIYEAVVYGVLKQSSGVLNFPIGRSSKDRKKMAVCFQGGKEAVTNFSVLNQFKNFAHLKLKLETGRTHQIRVHMAYVNHPLVGDEVYGPKNGIKLNGQCLHAKRIEFFHFKLGKKMSFECDLDKTFKNFLKQCK